MPGHARKDIVREGEIGVYHTWSRCVQRAHLCGDDPLTGQNFEHRRSWIKNLLEYQASVFAVDVGNYSILSNHQHLIARTRPDIAATWSDEQVAWRWKLAWPSWRDGQWVREPTDEEIEAVLARPERIPLLRASLASLSWFMARWKEPIAKLANAESGKKGHFYEQRFGSRELVDDGANLCGNVYVDLNQLRAGMASSLEDSNYSAIQDRLLAWRWREARESVERFNATASEDQVLATSEVERLLTDCFLAPIGNQGPSLLWNASDTPRPPAPATLESVVTSEAFHLLSDPEPTSADELHQPLEDSSTSTTDPDRSMPPAPGETTECPHFAALDGSDGRGVESPQLDGRREPTRRIHRRLQSHRRRRASDHVFLGIPCEQYLQLVQWTARQLGSEARDPPPETLDTTLRQSGVDPSGWLGAVEHFGEWFHRAVGQEDNLAATIRRAGQKWIQGIRNCRDVFT